MLVIRERERDAMVTGRFHEYGIIWHNLFKTASLKFLLAHSDLFLPIVLIDEE